MKYFDPDDLMLSVFFQIKKIENKGEMWELKYVALGLREFTALLRYNKEGHRATLKREKPIAIVKPRIIDETFDKLDDNLRINIPYTMKMLSYTNFEPSVNIIF